MSHLFSTLQVNFSFFLRGKEFRLLTIKLVANKAKNMVEVWWPCSVCALRDIPWWEAQIPISPSLRLLFHWCSFQCLIMKAHECQGESFSKDQLSLDHTLKHIEHIWEQPPLFISHHAILLKHTTFNRKTTITSLNISSSPALRGKSGGKRKGGKWPVCGNSQNKRHVR